MKRKCHNIFIVFFLCFILSCERNGVGAKLDLASSEDEYTSSVCAINQSLGFKDFRYKSCLQLLSEEECETWGLKRGQLKNITAGLKQVEPYEWNAYCYTYDCVYEGVVSSREDMFNISVNRGGFVIIYNPQIAYHFINRGESDLFSITCDCCE